MYTVQDYFIETKYSVNGTVENRGTPAVLRESNSLKAASNVLLLVICFRESCAVKTSAVYHVRETKIQQQKKKKKKKKKNVNV